MILAAGAFAQMPDCLYNAKPLQDYRGAGKQNASEHHVFSIIGLTIVTPLHAVSIMFEYYITYPLKNKVYFEFF